ncbi:MAG: sporulation protein YqfD [Clostridia bacterium]|nr:sporulation protein YqfD [Clostridia bacterium]
MLFIYRFIIGYLKIRLSGEFAEQIINSAVKNNISLWGLRFNKRAITGFISIKDFKFLREIRRKTGVKISIVEKRGLPFIINRYKKRSGILVGVVLFFLIINFLSSFIWCIEFSGNEAVKEDTLISHCQSIGIYEGIRKDKIDAKNDSQRLLLKSSGLAWAAFNIEGCVLTVDVTEIKNPEDSNTKSPCNLIATDDGIIKKIDVTSGNVLVTVGQAVSKGEILVSGIYENMYSTVFVPSKGTVSAKVYRTASAEGDFTIENSVENGKLKKQYMLEVFNIKIPLFIRNINGKFNSKLHTENLYIMEKKLPLKIYEKNFYFTEKRKETLSEEALLNKLRKDIEKQLESEGYIDFTVTNETAEKTDKGIILTQEIETVKNIAEIKIINLEQQEKSE